MFRTTSGVLMALAGLAALTAQEPPNVASPAAMSSSGSRYGFFRDIGEDSSTRRSGGSARRVFGGRAATLTAWPAVCALLDRYWATRCSASWVAPRWVLTAAHCVTPSIAYVRYNSRRQSAAEGAVVPVQYLYRHPEYKVVQEDVGRGLDVTVLHHDVGLVRTRDAMHLAERPPLAPLPAMLLYEPTHLKNEEVEVLGFGRTESAALGEELFTARLQLAACDRSAWFHCVCGVARASEPMAGVCAGDSGGPVIYRKAQVGVTSMGPIECASGGRAGVDERATSVFTALWQYAPLINTTIHDAELHMARLSAAPLAPLTARVTRALALLLLLACVS